VPVRRLLSTVLAGGLLLATAIPVAASPSACSGAGQVWPIETPAIRVADGVTFIEFDFAGLHPICLSDGTMTTASVEGHLWQRMYANGAVFVRFDETLSHDGGELQYRGNAMFNAGGWHSAVRTVGPSSGSLSGIHGQGTFSPIAADGSFTDEIYYTY
jgi:hypothetical protein